MQTDQQYDGLFPDDTNTQPLRILLHTFIDNDAGSTCYNVGDVITISSTQQYVCQKQDILTEENKKYLIGTLLPQAQVTLQRAFKVMPVVGSLFLDNSAKCGFQGGVRVPADYGRGSVGAQNADIVIFVTTRPIIESGNVLAFAGPCQEDQYGRPIAGHLNFNPSAITPSDYATAQQLGTAVHEMTHALGFTSSKFGSINVPVGSGRSASIMTTLNLGIGAGGTSKQVSVINSPNVVEFIRRHFACPNMQGAELEDDGGDGTALSHWEKRVFMNEYMTGSAVTNPVFSELTLAFFQDSGWYRVNYSVAETLYWGRGMGCSFAQQSCGSWPTQRGYFCEKNGAVGCTPDYVGKGQCVVNTYASDLPADSRYFSDPKKGGGSRLADFCPYVTAYDNGWCFASDMNTEMRLIDDGEFFSPASRCFISTLAKNIPFGSEQKPVCYETYCTDNNELKVRVGQTWYNCPAGGAIPIVGYGGLLTCPSNVSDLCSDSFAHYIGPYPVFFNITPTAGGPGTVVTINGKNFPPYVTVKISAMCENVTVISPNQIIASIPFITDVNPAQIIAELETVVITDPKGRTALGHKSFLLDVGYNGDYVDNTFNWVGKRWILGVALSVAVVIASIACAICCYQQ